MNENFFTVFIQDPERAALWNPIFPNGIPVRGPATRNVSVPGHPDTFAYFLDIRRITKDQRRQLITAIADHFNLDPAEVKKSIDDTPVLKENTTLVCANMRLFF
jgi:hypothetical protein